MTSRIRSNRPTTRLAALLTSTMATSLVFGFLLVGVSMTPRVAHAQKKAPPPPPVVLPPARYMIQWIDGGPGWESLFPRDINGWGDVAGGPEGTAFAYHSATGQAINLNELNAPWWDLNQAAPTTVTGWQARDAFGINDWGDLVGTATNINTNLPTRAYILVNALGYFASPTEFLLLPSVGTANQYGRRINNNGEAIGGRDFGLIRYQSLGATWPYYTAVIQPGMTTDAIMDINDDGVVVTRGSSSPTVSYRQLFAGAQPDVFNGLEFWSVSNGTSPWISGLITSSGKGKTAVPPGPMRLPVLGTANDVQRLASFGLYARAVNDHGDTTFESGGRGYLFYDAINPNTGTRYGTNGDGLLPLDQMVVNPDADWLDGIRIDGITNRDGTGLGVMCGFTPAGPDRGFLLIPFVP